jgi:hypothetical protein
MLQRTSFCCCHGHHRTILIQSANGIALIQSCRRYPSQLRPVSCPLTPAFGRSMSIRPLVEGTEMLIQLNAQVDQHAACTAHTSRVTRHTSHITRHTSHVTRRTSHLTPHTSHVTHHPSHVTHHTSHITRHTSHVTHHTSHAALCKSHVSRHIRTQKRRSF